MNFENYHELNPQVYELFKRFTFEVIGTGRRRYSAWAIINRMRWHSDIETEGERFKLSNDHISHYSRKFHWDYPQHAGFFVTHARKGEEELYQ